MKRPSYRGLEAEPAMKSPPWIHTITGRAVTIGNDRLTLTGTKMFRYRQSSLTCANADIHSFTFTVWLLGCCYVISKVCGVFVCNVVAMALQCGCQNVAVWLLKCLECFFSYCYVVVRVLLCRVRVFFLAWSNVVAMSFLGGCQGIAIWLLKKSEHF